MLGGLAVLAAGLALWFGVVAPLDAARRAASVRLDAALRTEAAVERLLSDLQAIRRKASPPASAAPLDAAIAETAQTAGLVLARVEDDPAGGVQATLQGVSSTALFPWLVDLQRRHGVVAAHLTVLKGEAGGLDVDATFVRAGP